MAVTVIVRDRVKARTLDPCVLHRIKSRDNTFPSSLWANISFSLSSLLVPLWLPQVPGHCGNAETREARPKCHLKGPWLHWCTVWIQERLQAELLFPQGGTIQRKGIHTSKALPWNPGGLTLRLTILVLGSEEVLYSQPTLILSADHLKWSLRWDQIARPASHYVGPWKLLRSL